MLRTSLLQAALIAALSGALYAAGLSVSPPHLTHDEIKFAFQAKALADTGRDINGRLLPVYFVEPGFSVGRDPLSIYVMAAVLSFAPLSEASIRFATVLVGALAVGLLYHLALEVFASRRVAFIVAAIMIATPTYYIHSRLALSVLYPVPFVVLWLIVLRRYLLRPRRRWAVLLGGVLGAGVYSYLAAAIMMPLYLLATCALLASRRQPRCAVHVAVGFGLMLLPVVLWQAVEPRRYQNIVSAYRLFDVQPGVQPTPVAVAEGNAVRRRVDTFWAAFDPGTMFFTGESSLQISTRQVGSFLTPVAVLLVVGAGALRERVDVVPRWLWAFGLVSAPLPAVIMADVEIRRWLVVVPFVAMISGFGIERLIARGRNGRLACAVLLLACAAQFGWFMHDYFGGYRERSSLWFGGNIRGALTRVLDDARSVPPSRIYIAAEIPWVDAYWRFYAMVNDQQDLLGRSEFVRVESGELPRPSVGAVLVAPAPEPDHARRWEAAGWVATEIIADLDGSPSLALVRPTR